MAQTNTKTSSDVRGFRRLVVALLIVPFLAIFLFWRIESTRIEQFRADLTDAIVPNFSWIMEPLTTGVQLVGSFQGYVNLNEQNQELRRELQQMKAWKEAALQLEQENAHLLRLNNVQLDPEFTYVTGVVLADSGSPFRQSVLINIGRQDGVLDGWAAMDGIGVVGRIAGVGRKTARVVLLTDTSMRVPVVIQPSGERAILAGDGTTRPTLELLENRQRVRPGDRIVTTGDGGVFPSNLLVGEVMQTASRELRATLLADYENLKFLRIARSQPRNDVDTLGSLIVDPGAGVSGSSGAVLETTQ